MDKWVHIALFSILVALCYWPFKPSWPQKAFLKKAVPIAFAALGYGIAIEFIQKNYIPNRSFDLGDIIADGFGSFIPLVYVLRAGKKKAGGKAGT